MKALRTSMQITISICFILFVIHYSSAQQSVIEVSGQILNDSIWDVDTVRVTGDIEVHGGATLTIHPGTCVEFQGNYDIKIWGWLMAVGAENDTIVFTVNDTTGFSNMEVNSGGWGGIRFQWGSGGIDTSKLICCKIEYAKGVEEGDELGGGISAHASKLIVSQCNITNNYVNSWGGGMHIEGSFALVKDNLIHGNKAPLGGGLSCHNNANIILTNNIITGNTAERGGGFYFHLSRSVIDKNIICNNYSTNRGGGFYLYKCADIVTCNLVVNNSADYKAGGCCIHASVPEFHNNTVSYNTSPRFGGMHIREFCNSNFMNNIIWGNVNTDSIGDKLQVFLEDVASNPNFYNCIIEDGSAGVRANYGITFTGDTLNIFNKNPLFIDPPDHAGHEYDGLHADWNIQETSPCINQGLDEVMKILPSETDMAGNSRIVHGYIDIGAYEQRISKLEKYGLIPESEDWIADTIKVTDHIIITDSTTLNIAPGTYVEFQGFYDMIIEGTLLAMGTEQDPIWFTIKDTLGFSNTEIIDGSWKGISFNNGDYGANGIMSDNDTSKMIHCIIEYAKNNGDYIMSGGGIKVNYFSRLVINNCTIRNNYGISGGGIGLTDGSSPFIENNIIYENRARIKGGGISSEGRSKPHIINNLISNNAVVYEDGWPRGGGGISCAYSDPVILGNIISNNVAPSYGGGVAIFDSYPLFANNSVCYNEQFDFGGGGIHTETSPDIYNSIIWGNVNAEGPEYAQIGGSGDPDFYHCNIWGGLLGIKSPENYWGQTTGLIESDPSFVSPSQGPGIGYDGLSANWAITDFSPNINAGIPVVAELHLPALDIAGNRRINHEIVDIGAYESQADPLEIVKQPVNLSKCEGDGISFQVQTNGLAQYQWYKDLEPVPGETDSILIIPSVSTEDEANYNCIVENGYGEVSSNNVFLVVKSHPKILTEPESQWVNMNKPLILKMTVDGTAPISFQWMKNGSILQDGTLPEFDIDNPAYEDEGVYSCVAFNACSEVYTNPFTLYMAPQICMVTVDPVTGNNLVVWEKNSSGPISYYNIYRESNYAGIFDLLATVPYDNLSVILDSTADPTSRAYIYKITAIDNEGIETDKDLCSAHKTIHLLVTTNPETHSTQLDWDRYVGFEYGTYVIYRSDTTYDFNEVDQISSNNSTWTDKYPGTGTKYYRIGALKPTPCYPSGTSKKIDSGPYSHSMSNIEDNRLQTRISEYLDQPENIGIYPNPFGQSTLLTFKNTEGHSYTLYLIDLSGKVCRIVENITTSEYVLEKGELKEGLYFVELRGEKLFRGKIIIE